MNTIPKCILTEGLTFQLSMDWLNSNEPGIWLLIDHPGPYEVTPNGIKVGIPIALWEHLRKYTGADFSSADLTDEAIHKLAVKDADKIRANSRKNSMTKKAMLLEGPHAVARSRKNLIAQLTEQLQQDRQRQRDLRNAVLQYDARDVVRGPAPLQVR